MTALGIKGVILVGGKARRMGGIDKGLLELGGKTLLEHIIARAAPQVDALALNVPEHKHIRYQHFHLPLLFDSVQGSVGPLAGVLAALEGFAKTARYVMTFTADAPFIPTDLVLRLHKTLASTQADIVCASSQGRRHPLFALWPTALRTALHHAIEQEGLRKVEDWTSRYTTRVVPFDEQPHDPFFNINCPEDIVQARQLWAAACAS